MVGWHTGQRILGWHLLLLQSGRKSVGNQAVGGNMQETRSLVAGATGLWVLAVLLPECIEQEFFDTESTCTVAKCNFRSLNCKYKLARLA